MNLAHLYYFKTLAETKNRRQTAQSLSITQPTLSQAISKLEAELGVGALQEESIRCLPHGRRGRFLSVRRNLIEVPR